MQVDRVHTVWGDSIGYALGSARDHRDIYYRQLQLYEGHDATCQRVKLYTAKRSSRTPVTEAKQEADPNIVSI